METSKVPLSRQHFEALQKELEMLEQAAGKGEDMPGHHERMAEIDSLMAQSNWEIHPDHGVVPKGSALPSFKPDLWIIETPTSVWSTAKQEVAAKYENKTGCMATEYYRGVGVIGPLVRVKNGT
jgi:hypothetical protein